MIVPTVEYCSFYTGSVNNAELANLQRMQNQALRVCLRTRVRDISIATLHSESVTEMLDIRRRKQLLGIMWKKSKGADAIITQNIRTRGTVKSNLQRGGPKPRSTKTHPTTEEYVSGIS